MRKCGMKTKTKSRLEITIVKSRQREAKYDFSMRSSCLLLACEYNLQWNIYKLDLVGIKMRSALAMWRLTVAASDEQAKSSELRRAHVDSQRDVSGASNPSNLFIDFWSISSDGGSGLVAMECDALPCRVTQIRRRIKIRVASSQFSSPTFVEIRWSELNPTQIRSKL